MLSNFGVRINENNTYPIVEKPTRALDLVRVQKIKDICEKNLRYSAAKQDRYSGLREEEQWELLDDEIKLIYEECNRPSDHPSSKQAFLKKECKYITNLLRARKLFPDERDNEFIKNIAILFENKEIFERITSLNKEFQARQIAAILKTINPMISDMEAREIVNLVELIALFDQNQRTPGNIYMAKRVLQEIQDEESTADNDQAILIKFVRGIKSDQRAQSLEPFFYLSMNDSLFSEDILFGLRLVALVPEAQRSPKVIEDVGNFLRIGQSEDGMALLEGMVKVIEKHVKKGREVDCIELLSRLYEMTYLGDDIDDPVDDLQDVNGEAFEKSMVLIIEQCHNKDQEVECRELLSNLFDTMDWEQEYGTVNKLG